MRRLREFVWWLPTRLFVALLILLVAGVLLLALLLFCGS